MLGPGLNALNFLVSTAFDLYIMLVAIRFIMQITRADYHNSLSQFIVKVTNPLLVPLRKFVPGVAGYDIAALVLCFLLVVVKLVLYKMTGFSESIGGFAIALSNASWLKLLLLACVALIELFFNVFIYSIIIQAILSWFPATGYNPVTSILHSITSPVLSRVRKKIPPISGLDLSALAAIIGLIFLKILVVQSLVAIVATL